MEAASSTVLLGCPQTIRNTAKIILVTERTNAKGITEGTILRTKISHVNRTAKFGNRLIPPIWFAALNLISPPSDSQFQRSLEMEEWLGWRRLERRTCLKANTDSPLFSDERGRLDQTSGPVLTPALACSNNPASIQHETAKWPVCYNAASVSKPNA